MDKVNKYSRDQFLAFVLLYAAHIDIEFSPEEKNMIKERVSPEDFDEVYGDFNDMSDYEALQSIMNHKNQFFASDEDKERLFTEIKTLFFADGKYAVQEKTLYHFLKKLID